MIRLLVRIGFRRAKGGVKTGRIKGTKCQFLSSPDHRFRTRTCTACILAALFPTRPLHYTVALDSGSEARYVRRQGRGLGI